MKLVKKCPKRQTDGRCKVDGTYCSFNPNSEFKCFAEPKVVKPSKKKGRK